MGAGVLTWVAFGRNLTAEGSSNAYNYNKSAGSQCWVRSCCDQRQTVLTCHMSRCSNAKNALSQQGPRADVVVVMVVLPCLQLCVWWRLWATCCLFGSVLDRDNANQCNSHSQVIVASLIVAGHIACNNHSQVTVDSLTVTGHIGSAHQCN